MADLKGIQRSQYVRQMFGRIARRYDLLNRLMTLGQDGRWRRLAVDELRLTPQARVLDIGSGTGDLAFECLRREPQARVVAADFTPEMVARGSQRHVPRQPHWVLADAARLPFAPGSFEGVVSGFLLRNVPHVSEVLKEQVRVLAPGGRLVSLETSPPPANILRPLLIFHFRVVIPLLGRVVAGDAEAYRYLPRSTESFEEPNALATLFQHAGLRAVGYTRLMLGTIALHRGTKAG